MTITGYGKFDIIRRAGKRMKMNRKEFEAAIDRCKAGEEVTVLNKWDKPWFIMKHIEGDSYKITMLDYPLV